MMLSRTKWSAFSIMTRTLSHAQWIVITVFLVPCLVGPSTTLSIRVETDPSYHSSSQLRNPPSPFAIRYSSSREIVPSQHEDDKTDSRSYEYVDSDESGVTEQYLESATRPIPSIPPALRRHFARLTDNVQDSDVETQQKPKKKPKRRRKVKRPAKKSTTPKAAEDDLGIPENSMKPNSTGEKNLALEIGSDDGKYALINVFFDHSNDTSAPGIISYQPSDDFSKDNERTLGNVQQNDIWLSDGHLLILKGGDFDLNSKDRWKPIDNYERRKPTLKIPLDTNNPPPFPVFVNESGPPIFLGPPPPFGPFIPDFGSNETFDPSRLPPPGLIPLYPNGTIPDFFRPPPPGFSMGNNTFPPPPYNFQRPGPPSKEGGVYGNSPPGGGLYGGGGPPGPGYGYGVNAPLGNLNNTRLPPIFFPQAGPNNNSRPPFPFPFPPPGDRNSGQPPGNGPQFPFLPPLVLNPNDNETDDPSIFLPPPYDFDYYEDNSTIVPPGPFAPGLVVPPPRDFYTVYNRTSPAFNPVPPTHATPFVIQDARSQRPNAKKPKFPITQPPDDSLEAAYPITSPAPVTTTAFGKKRKQRPGKTSKLYVNPLLTKYTKGDSASEEISAEIPDDQVNDYKPVILVARPIVTIPTTTTPKPPNYVYVRGKLKTLAEIEAEQAVEDAGEVSHISTPPPPFDELGYPSRNVDDNSNSQPILFDFPRKTSPKGTIKPYIETTSKYTTNYNPNIYNKKNEKYPVVYPTSLTRPYGNGEQNLIQPSPTPILYSENPKQGQNSNDGIYFPDNYTRQKAGTLRPAYFNPGLSPAHNDHVQTQQQRTNFQPNDLSVYQQHNANRQQNLQNQNDVNNNQQHSIPRPNSGFRPAFPPPQLQQQIQRARSQILFPGPTNQPSFSFNPLFQLPHNQGYYSPITQYRQPLDQNQNGRNPFFPSQSVIPNSPGFNNNNLNSHNFNNGLPQYFQPQQFLPQQQYHQQQIQPSYNPAHAHANYIQQQQQQPQQEQPQQQHQPAAVPLHQDILVNYREPLPQYNTESESITIRSVPKAGPAPSTLQLQYGPDHTGAGSNTAAVQQSSGSFYSFQRGGPGGFSYKIRL